MEYIEFIKINYNLLRKLYNEKGGYNNFDIFCYLAYHKLIE
jgi:hypothetical protein